MFIRIILLLTVYLTAFFIACHKDEKSHDDATSASPRDPIYQLVPPSSSGIRFSNRIAESFENNILINSYLYNGGGVAVLDANRDGLPDLYFTATQESDKLFLNKGNLQFEDITQQAGIKSDIGIKTGVTVVDVNADGWPDIYVCRSGMAPTPDRANLLFVNNGINTDGIVTFTEQAAAYGLDDRSASNHANFFDFDLDGDLDVYILNHPVKFQDVNRVQVVEDNGRYIRSTDPFDQWESDKLLRNDGAGNGGRFTDVSTQAGIRNRAWGLSATVADFNDDRYPDIFVANDYIEPDLLYINNRNGTFSVQTDRYFRHMSNHTMGVDIADFNNDGLPDVVALDMIAEDNQRQKELMTTMILDRYTNLVRFGYGHQIMRNVLQLNTGAKPEQGAVFCDIGVLAGISNTDWSWSALLADYDNDGWKDLYITNGYRRDVSNLDYLNYTVDSVMKKGGINPRNFKSIDDYLRLIPSTPLKNYMFHNRRDLTFANVTDEWGLGQTSYSNGCAWADLDTDGDLELIVNQIDGDILLYKNLSVEKSKGNWLQITLKGHPANPGGIGAKVRISTPEGFPLQYQEFTPVRGFFSSCEYLLHFGLGAAGSAAKVEIQWPPDGRIQILENVPARKRLTLEYQQAKPGQWAAIPAPKPLFERAQIKGLQFRHLEDEFIDFNRERLLPHKFSNLGPYIAVGDVNGDRLQDVFIGGARNQPGALFIQQQNATFIKGQENIFSSDVTYEDMGCAFFDADADGDLDLYVASGGSTYDAGSANYQDRLYLNDGKGNFTRAPQGALPSITASGSRVSVYDFDHDGDQDIFVGGLVTPGFYPTPPQTCLLRNDAGRFTEVCQQVAPQLHQLGMIRDLHWTDLDGDANPELIVAGEWLPLTVFANKNGRLEEATARFGLENTNGWWHCIASADMDGDGDTDLIAGNLGLNSRLKASEREPLRLFAADFDKNGSLDPILAYYNQGKLYPLALRDMLIKQLPPLKKKFVFHRDYGKATLDQVFPANDLQAARQFVAKTFASAYFENINGKFSMRALPVEAQFAPVNRILLEDLNADGSPDLILAGNSYSADVESGRYDAGNGVLLINDGKGRLSVLPNRHSGFWAIREARDLSKLQLSNGKTALLVANNNDVMEVFLKINNR